MDALSGFYCDYSAPPLKSLWYSAMTTTANLHPDIVVIGAGHAGCEAASAAARLGCEVVLISMSLDTVRDICMVSFAP